MSLSIRPPFDPSFGPYIRLRLLLKPRKLTKSDHFGSTSSIHNYNKLHPPHDATRSHLMQPVLVFVFVFTSLCLCVDFMQYYCLWVFLAFLLPILVLLCPFLSILCVFQFLFPFISSRFVFSAFPRVFMSSRICISVHLPTRKSVRRFFLRLQNEENVNF